ncbi:HNH endonuclease [Brachybacterium muris]|uniref:HNH endonuclease n=1 Tax=Brachybacterium muris TaxID=219301 RepID=UPI003B968636
MASSRTGSATWKRVRKVVIARAIRDGLDKCPLCGTLLDLHGTGDGAPIDVDHLIPYSLGGQDHPDACRVTCRSCNRSRGNGTRTRRGAVQAVRAEPRTIIEW